MAAPKLWWIRLLQCVALVTGVRVTHLPWTDGGGCYFELGEGGTECFLIAKEHKSWSDARATCTSLGGRLVAEPGHTTLQVLTEAFRQASVSSAWVGASKQSTQWTWDGDRVLDINQWTNWKVAHPRGPESAQDCLWIVPQDQYTWADTDCSTRAGYVCQAGLNTEACRTGGWSYSEILVSGSSCFLFRDGTSRSKVTWSQAQSACAATGARLAKIDQGIQQRLASASPGLDAGVAGYWVGLTRAKWTWTTGAAINSVLWGDQEPSTAGDCVTLSTSPGRETQLLILTAKQCQDVAPYVCRIAMDKVRAALTTTPDTTTTTPATTPPTTTRQSTTLATPTTPKTTTITTPKPTTTYTTTPKPTTTSTTTPRPTTTSTTTPKPTTTSTTTPKPTTTSTTTPKPTTTSTTTPRPATTSTTTPNPTTKSTTTPKPTTKSTTTPRPTTTTTPTTTPTTTKIITTTTTTTTPKPTTTTLKPTSPTTTTARPTTTTTPKPTTTPIRTTTKPTTTSTTTTTTTSKPSTTTATPATVKPTAPPLSVDPVCAKADLAFLLDSSSDVTAEEWHPLRKFAATLSDLLRLDGACSRLALASYGSETLLYTRLNDTDKTPQIVRTILAMSHQNTAPNLAKAIDFVSTGVYKAEYGDRAGVANVLVIVSTFRDQSALQAAESASTRARSRGMIVVAVHLQQTGSQDSRAAVQELVSQPSQQYLIQVQGFPAQLNQISVLRDAIAVLSKAALVQQSHQPHSGRPGPDQDRFTTVEHGEEAATSEPPGGQTTANHTPHAKLIPSGGGTSTRAADRAFTSGLLIILIPVLAAVLILCGIIVVIALIIRKRRRKANDGGYLNPFDMPERGLDGVNGTGTPLRPTLRASGRVNVKKNNKRVTVSDKSPNTMYYNAWNIPSDSVK